MKINTQKEIESLNKQIKSNNVLYGQEREMLTMKYNDQLNRTVL